MIKAYSYIRFSSKKQIEGRSLDRQTERAREYAERHGLHLQDLSFQDLGVSGFRGVNAREGALSEFIDAVERGLIEKGSYLLVENFDRLSRLPVNRALTQLQSLVSLGIVVVTLTDGKVYQGDLDLLALMHSIVHMERAHSESLRKSGHLKDVWDSKRSKATSKPTKAVLPSWLKYNEDKTQIEVDDAKAVVVRLIFELTINGMGRSSIVRNLVDNGIKPIGKNTKKWHPSFVAKILQGRAVLGEYHPHYKTPEGKRIPAGDPIPDYYPQVIDESTWLQAQSAIRNRMISSTGIQRGNKLRNLLTGIAQCECGASMNFVNKGSKKSNVQFYLACSDARYGNGCKYVGHRYKNIELTVLYALQNALSSVVRESSLNTKESELQGHVDTLQGDYERTEAKLFELGYSEAIHRYLKSVEDKLKSAKEELIRVKAEVASMREPLDFKEVLMYANSESKRLKLHQHLKKRLERIVVYKDKSRIDIVVDAENTLKLERVNDEVWSINGKDAFAVDYRKDYKQAM